MNANRINCNAGQRYIGRVRVPIGDLLRSPTVPGTVSGLEVRITAERHGAAIDPAVDGLTPVEFAPDVFVLDVSQALHQTYLLPLGKGASYFVIWSLPNVADYLVDDYTVWDETIAG